MSEESGIVITLHEEDFLVTLGKDEIKLLVIPLGIKDVDDAISVVEARDVETDEVSYSAVIPEHDGEHNETWEKAVQVAGLVMAQIDVLRESGVFS